MAVVEGILFKSEEIFEFDLNALEVYSIKKLKISNKTQFNFNLIFIIYFKIILIKKQYKSLITQSFFIIFTICFFIYKKYAIYNYQILIPSF